MDYKGYWIKTGEYGQVYFWQGGEDNYDAEFDDGRWKDNATGADSIEHAKELIDDLILEQL
jgi:hypothetical protein